MNRLALLSLVLLGGLGGPPPEPEPPKLPAVPGREEELLRPMPALPEAPTSYQLATAARHAYRRAREIDDYLYVHVAARGEELRWQRLAILEFADRLEADRREAEHRADEAHRAWVASQHVPTAAEERHTVNRPPAPTPAPPRAQPMHIRAPKPKPPPVRCPVKHCQARPGDRCRGHSGEAMDTLHPERVRAFERTKKE